MQLHERLIGMRALLALGAVSAMLSLEPALGRQETSPAGVVGREDTVRSDAESTRPANRLARESSPYLLQHAHNPVDWYPWGEEAFARARKEGKAIFLSVGYSTCHWCHVMERESFENEEIAAVMNEHFVCIKVDREERPDVDAIYMSAVQSLTGQGGWPMSVFLTPDGRPFFGGTYFPPEDRFGRPGFKNVLLRVAEVWARKREDVLRDADRLTDHIRKMDVPAGEAELGVATLDTAFQHLAASYDERHGGFGGAPKFPRPHALSLLLRYWKRRSGPDALEMVTTTLERMWRGGMYDHLGGGFHRYSTDEEWLVPHFEKMLYDQALIAGTCIEAYQATGGETFAAIARDIFRYVLRDLADPKGGFHSAEDADSEGEEGKFYLWTKGEILERLGEKDGELFCKVYGVREDGNYHDEATRAFTGRNILHLPAPLSESATRLGTTTEEMESKLGAMRDSLFAARESRVRPSKDDKVLTDWNGLMISSLARGGNALAEPRYVDAARRAAEFILANLRSDGRLLHRWRSGNADIPAFLDDYAFLALGLLDLYEATFEDRWLAESVRLADEMIALFGDPEGGAFYLTSADGEPLIKRTRELYDGAIPSGNSAAALLLLRLGRIRANPELEKRGEAVLRHFSGAIARMPTAFPFALQALDFVVGPAREIVLAGDAEDPEVEGLRRVLRRRFLPNTVVVLHRPGDAGRKIEALAPFVASQARVHGKAAAYVCENYACKFPVTDPAALAELLETR